MQDGLNTGISGIEMVQGRITRAYSSERMRKNGWKRLRQEKDRLRVCWDGGNGGGMRKPHLSVEAAFMKVEAGKVWGKREVWFMNLRRLGSIKRKCYVGFWTQN